MTIDFLSGFETGDFSEWDIDSGACSVQGTIKHTGNYSCRFNADNAQVYIAHTNTCTRVSFWIYLAVETTYDTTTRICGKEDQLSLALYHGDLLRLLDGETVLATMTHTDGMAGSWHRISLSFDPTNNAAKVYFDGIEIYSTTNATGSSSTGKYFGFYNSVVGDMYLDDIVQDDTESTADIGDIRVLRAGITGAGNYTDFDSEEPPSSVHYENIDELSPNDADYNYHTPAEPAKECYALENCSSIGLISTDMIMAVQTWCRMKKAQAANLSILRRDNNVDYESVKSATTSWINYFHVDSVMPNGGSSWLQSRFDAFEVGISYDGVGKDPFISWVSVMVAYCSEMKGRIDAESTMDVISSMEDAPFTGIISALSSLSGILTKVAGQQKKRSFISSMWNWDQ